MESNQQNEVMKQMTIDRLNVRDDFSDEEYENVVQQKCSDQIDM